VSFALCRLHLDVPQLAVHEKCLHVGLTRDDCLRSNDIRMQIMQRKHVICLTS
jgi:hypothetical protein